MCRISWGGPHDIPTCPRPLRRSQLHHAAVMTWTQLPVLHALCAKTSLLPEAKLRGHVCVQRPGSRGLLSLGASDFSGPGEFHSEQTIAEFGAAQVGHAYTADSSLQYVSIII